MNKIIDAIPDLMILSGVAMASYGFGLIGLAYGFIVGGVMMLALGVLRAFKGNK